MKFNKMITTVDAHTGGECIRIVLNGVPELPGSTMSEKRDFLRKNYDFIRTSLLQEPRGPMGTACAVITPPVSSEAVFGVIWMGKGIESSYIDMCGSGTISLTTAAIEMGMVDVQEPETKLTMDTPAGRVCARARVKNGKVESVSLQNVPSFFYKTVKIQIPGYYEIPADIAFGGANYAIVEASDLGFIASITEIKKAKDFLEEVLLQVNAQVSIQHPEKSYINRIVALLINDKPENAKADAKNIYVASGAGVLEIDRSPCGTGSSARMANLYSKGKLKVGSTFVTESIIGSLFYGKVIEEVKVGDKIGILPEITGNAFVTGIHHFFRDESDPFKDGFLL